MLSHTMKTVWLVRHGQTAWNAEKRYLGHTDQPLNAVGQRQADRVGQRLASCHIEQIITSDLARATQTAAAIAAHCTCPMQTDSRWREMNFGAWEGLRYADIMQRDAAHFTRWTENPATVAPPHGETLTEVAERVRLGWDAVMESSAETIALVAHGSSLQLLLCHLLNMPPTAYWRLRLTHGSLTQLTLYPAGAILSSLNETAHLT